MDTKKTSTFETITDPTPKRVLHVIHRMRPGGVQTLVMNLYRHFDRSQVQFDFAVRSQQPEFYDEEIKALGGRLFHLPWGTVYPFNLMAYKRSFATILQKSGPFIAVHSHVGLYSGHVLPIAKKAKVPKRIAHSHNTNYSKNSSPLRKFWATMMRREIQINATHLLACSLAAGHWLYNAEPQNDSRFMHFPNAIDLDHFALIHGNQLYWREQAQLPLTGPLLGHIGRFDHQKNHTFLLEAFATFLKYFPHAKLILVGEGDLKKQVEHHAAAKGITEAVCFLGARSDIPQILGALDLFVFPSQYEGLGIVLVEAQAAGVHCLVSDIVPHEVDLGLGLVHFESLDAGISTWVNTMRQLLGKSSPTWEKRKATLQNAGYDICHSVELIQKLYHAQPNYDDR